MQPTHTISQKVEPANTFSKIALDARGISFETAALFGLQPSRHGWIYPVSPNADPVRFKAYDSSASPKYRWLPTRPADATFYDPTGQLHTAIVHAHHTLILAAGEPDVWVLGECGLFHATCTLHGEGTIPGWLVDELRRLEVQTVRLWPDCDAAGLRHAAKIAAALAACGIAVEIYALPYAEDSKADLNTLWLDCRQDRARFIAALESCPVLDIPDQEPPQPAQRTEYTPPAEITTLYEQWCLEVERAAVTAWQIDTRTNSDQWSQKPFRAPQRDDQNPSARWSYTLHGFKDFATGDFVSTAQVAALLGMPTWHDYKIDHAPMAQQKSSHTRIAPVETGVITPPRHYEHGLPAGIRELLNNWHNNGWVHIEGNDVARADGLYTYLEIRHDLIWRGQVAPDAALSMHEAATLNRFGLSYRVLHDLEQSELFTFLFPYSKSVYTGKEMSTIGAGRPSARYALPAMDELWDRFFEYHRGQMWRALLVTKYPDLPVDLLTYDDVLLAMDELRDLADCDRIGTINDAIHDLLVEFDGRLREAQAELDWRIAELRRRYINTDPAPYQLAPGVTFSKPSQHKEYHLAITLQRDGGEIQDRYAVARAGGWSLPAYRSALTRAEKLLGEAIVTVPNFIGRGIITTECESVPLACEAVDPNAYMRGRIKLHAPNGETVTVSPGYAKHFDYDRWLADNGGSAEIYVWERSVDKLESLVTSEESANRDEVSKRQTAINSRRDYAKEASERASAPGKVETWVHHQGVMIAPELGVNPDDPHVWRALFEKVRTMDEQTQTENAAHEETQPTLAGSSTAESERPPAAGPAAALHRGDARRRSGESEGGDSSAGSRSERAGNFRNGRGNRAAGTRSDIDRARHDGQGSQDSGVERIHDRTTADDRINAVIVSATEPDNWAEVYEIFDMLSEWYTGSVRRRHDEDVGAGTCF